MLLSMASCGGDDSSKASEDVSNIASEVASEATSEATSITKDEFSNKIKEKIAFEGEMIDYTKLENYPLDNFGIKADAYTQYVYLEVSDTTASYESVGVFAATSEENAALIKEKLDSHISSLKAQFTNYNATIIEMVNASVVKQEGNKVYLIISPNLAEVEAVVKANLTAFN